MKPIGRRAPQGSQMGTAVEFLAEVVRKSPHIGALRAAKSKIELRQPETNEVPRHHANEPRLAFDVFAFACAFVEWNAFDLDRGIHRRSLVLVALKRLHRRLNLRLG